MLSENQHAQIPEAEKLERLDIGLIDLHLEDWHTTLEINLPILLGLPIALILLAYVVRKNFNFKSLTAATVTLRDPFTGSTITIVANHAEKKIAHKIWTQLVTRKVAIPFERDNDVIVEVYNSWFSLFGEIRQLIGDIPVEKLKGREKDDIIALVGLSTSLLNECLRPHLTTWQAKFRRWYEEEEKEYPSMAPQAIQEKYEHYEELVKDLERANKQVRVLAHELKKLVIA
jgi:hypothetical protein